MTSFSDFGLAAAKKRLLSQVTEFSKCESPTVETCGAVFGKKFQSDLQMLLYPGCAKISETANITDVYQISVDILGNSAIHKMLYLSELINFVANRSPKKPELIDMRVLMIVIQELI